MTISVPPGTHTFLLLLDRLMLGSTIKFSCNGHVSIDQIHCLGNDRFQITVTNPNANFQPTLTITAA